MPPGYTIQIKSTSNSSLIATDGTITTTTVQSTVKLVFTVTKLSDGTTADTQGIDVVVSEKDNSPPIASNVEIIPNSELLPEIGQTLTGSCIYFDVENDSVDPSTFQWYRGSSENGSDKILISGATSNSYTLGPSDLYQYIFFEVTPRASPGVTPGIAVVMNQKDLWLRLRIPQRRR